MAWSREVGGSKVGSIVSSVAPVNLTLRNGLPAIYLRGVSEFPWNPLRDGRVRCYSAPPLQ